MEFDILKKIVSEILGVDPREITEGTTFADDLGADSLDLLQVVIGIEEHFNISIAEEELGDIVTVKDALDKINRVLGN